ncbi:MAG: helix-turn-helix domain-containing protein [Lactococcus lactis]|uniref:helix-turn-helix domain-containing protein n=1 Tax=Lactococcus lactis TaxID=1358 RepID=UPI002651AF8F|nr:helix-turn-helix domain-containing protein [Lactococcus lactis]
MNRVEKDLGYPRNALHNYKKGGSIPSGIRLMELANYFDVTPEFLIGKDSLLKKKQDLTSREIFDNMSLSQRHEIAELCQEWLLSLPYN